MFYLFVIDYFTCLFCSVGLSYILFNCLDYFWIIYLCLLPITGFLREHEAKIKGRLKAIERKEYLRFYDGYDNFVYIANNNEELEEIDNLD